MKRLSEFQTVLLAAQDDVGKMQRGRVVSACAVALFFVCTCLAGGTEKSRAGAPVIAVYTAGHLPVENASVAITNPRRDVAMLVTSVDFENQLPESRYFYHGVYGPIGKRGNNYEHGTLGQMLSLPVGTCFLLPGQSASWKRPLRVLADGYRVQVKWREIPLESVPSCVWFRSFASKNTLMEIYEPLSQAQKDRYSNITAGTGSLPRVVVEGEFPAASAEVAVSCICEQEAFSRPADDIPEGGIEFHLEPIWDSVVVTKDKVTFRKGILRKGYEQVPGPDISPIVIDLIFLCSRTQEKTIPCILSPEVFGDLIEVKRPSEDMYYNPGITYVPLKVFRAIIERARDRGLPVQLRRIDPNSLGRQHVLVIGVNIGDSVGDQDPRG
jgi:hypothetical protein